MAEPFELPVRTTAPIREDISRRNISKSENAGTPVTPPTRYISSTYSTPGSTFGQEQDAIILELNSRYIKAGIEGESYPQCRYNFTPSVAKRVGDYRQYLPNYVRPKESLDTWGEGYELWRNDIRGLSLGLLSDNMERAIREINNKHLLVDAGIARLVLVVPSLLPHPVLSSVLQTLFERWPYSSITLLPTATTTLIAAGLRSGLVVDFDWEETVVTAVYEYREVRSFRTTRATKMTNKNVATWIKESLQPEDRFDLEIVEEVLKRMGENICTTDPDHDDERALQEDDVVIDWPTDSFSRPISFSKRGMQAQIAETMLGREGESYPDDEELPLQRIIYNTLLAAPPDIRGICISRIVFTGDGSENQGLVSAVLKSFTTLVEHRGWNGVQGSRSRAVRSTGPVEAKPAGDSGLAQTKPRSADAKHDDVQLSKDKLAEERYLREKAKHTQPVVHGSVRQVESLGPWCGASLITALRVKSFVEIQRDRFLAHGLGGASRELDVSVVPQQGRGPLSTRSKAGERTSWTLSGWG